MSHTKKRITAAALAAVAITAALGAVTPASAEPWNANVTLSGAIFCPGSNVVGVPENVAWAWVTSDGGSAGWASISNNGSQVRYTVPIRVATWGSNVTVKVGCAVTGERATTFRVGRPTVGSSSGRDLRWVI